VLHPVDYEAIDMANSHNLFSKDSQLFNNRQN